MGAYLGTTFISLNTTRAVDFFVIESLTEPVSTRQGAIWIKRAPSGKALKVKVLDYINPSDDLIFQPDTVYLCVDTSLALESVIFELFRFTEILFIEKSYKCSVLIGSSVQDKSEVHLYDIVSNSFKKVPTAELPMMIRDTLFLDSFLGTGLEITSLFNELEINEGLDLEVSLLEPVEALDLNKFLGVTLLITSFFEELEITETLSLFTGGEQVYP